MFPGLIVLFYTRRQWRDSRYEIWLSVSVIACKLKWWEVTESTVQRVPVPLPPIQTVGGVTPFVRFPSTRVSVRLSLRHGCRHVFTYGPRLVRT